MALAATVTAISYDEAADLVTVSPLGAEQSTQIVVDNLTLVFDCDPVVGHPLVCKPDALGNRMVIYGLADAHDAADALVRELIFAWSGLAPETDDRVGELGGVDSRIAVTWTPAAEQDLAALLLRFADRIGAAREQFTRKYHPLVVEPEP